MRSLVVIMYMLLLSMNISAQVIDFRNIPDSVLIHLSEMGSDTESLLTKYESEYFNFIFKEIRKNFDFTGKNIAFIFRGGKSDKVDYFEGERERYADGTTMTSRYLRIFDEIQKVQSGGYDAVIVYWSKMAYPTEELIKRLNKKKLL